jgi:hypothetical protein
MVTVGSGFTVIVISFDVAGDGTAQTFDDVIITLTLSPFCKDEF